MIYKDIDENTIIFTTGVFLKPKKINVKEKELWGWTVEEFIDDSFKNVEIHNPPEVA